MQKQILIFLTIFSYGLLQAADIFKAIETNNKKMIQSWLKYNPDIDLCNKQGQTVLMKAVEFGNKSLVYKLLKQGAFVNAVDQFGRTALDYAVELSHKKIVKMLVANQGAVTIESNAVRCQEMICSYSFLKRVAKIVLITTGVILMVVILANSWMIVWPLALGSISGSIILGGIALGGIALGCGSVYAGAQIGKEYNSCKIDILKPVV